MTHKVSYTQPDAHRFWIGLILFGSGISLFGQFIWPNPFGFFSFMMIFMGAYLIAEFFKEALK